jgi:hypothetical protein
MAAGYGTRQPLRCWIMAVDRDSADAPDGEAPRLSAFDSGNPARVRAEV